MHLYLKSFDANIKYHWVFGNLLLVVHDNGHSGIWCPLVVWHNSFVLSTVQRVISVHATYAQMSRERIRLGAKCHWHGVYRRLSRSIYTVRCLVQRMLLVRLVTFKPLWIIKSSRYVCGFIIFRGFRALWYTRWSDCWLTICHLVVFAAIVVSLPLSSGITNKCTLWLSCLVIADSICVLKLIMHYSVWPPVEGQGHTPKR